MTCTCRSKCGCDLPIPRAARQRLCGKIRVKQASNSALLTRTRFPTAYSIVKRSSDVYTGDVPNHGLETVHCNLAVSEAAVGCPHAAHLPGSNRGKIAGTAVQIRITMPGAGTSYTAIRSPQTRQNQPAAQPRAASLGAVGVWAHGWRGHRLDCRPSLERALRRKRRLKGAFAPHRYRYD